MESLKRVSRTLLSRRNEFSSFTLTIMFSLECNVIWWLDES